MEAFRALAVREPHQLLEPLPGEAQVEDDFRLRMVDEELDIADAERPFLVFLPGGVQVPKCHRNPCSVHIWPQSRMYNFILMFAPQSLRQATTSISTSMLGRASDAGMTKVLAGGSSIRPGAYFW